MMMTMMMNLIDDDDYHDHGNDYQNDNDADDDDEYCCCYHIHTKHVDRIIFTMIMMINEKLWFLIDDDGDYVGGDDFE